MSNRSREDIIHSMCMTFRHDYGLLEEQEKKSLFRKMAQIFDNDIASECMMQSDVDNYEEEKAELEEKLSKYEEPIYETILECHVPFFKSFLLRLENNRGTRLDIDIDQTFPMMEQKYIPIQTKSKYKILVIEDE